MNVANRGLKGTV